jgi:DNA-binding transcriptional regulator YiaG
MSHTLHSLARTTPKTRAEIRALREAGLTQRELMKRYSVGKGTILQWRKREEGVRKIEKTVRTQCSQLK